MVNSVGSQAVEKSRVSPAKRSHYKHFTNIQTRWADNDVRSYSMRVPGG